MPSERRALVVHVVHRPPAPVLRFVDQVVGAQPLGIEFRFSQGVLTDFDIDVVHVPEHNLDILLGARGATGPQRLLASLALARNLRRHRIALVRTLPVGPDRSKADTDRLAQHVLDRATTLFVAPNADDPRINSSRARIIRHPHFRDRYIGYPRGDQVPGRILCVAARTLPSSTRKLLAAVRVMSTRNATLRVAGVASPELERQLQSATARHGRVISTRLELLSDGAQVHEMTQAELVVFPQPVESSEDLQAVYMALSLDRPVLAPHTTVLARLAHEVGRGWVHLSDGPITPEALDAAVRSIRDSSRSARPELTDGSLAAANAAYADVFRAAARAARGGNSG